MSNKVKALPTPQDICKLIEQAEKVGIDVVFTEIDCSEFKKEKDKVLLEDLRSVITLYVKRNTKWITLFVDVGKEENEHIYHLYAAKDICLLSALTSIYDIYYFKGEIEIFTVLQSKLLGYRHEFIQSQINKLKKREE